jgi:hypothetical protein
MVATRRPGFDFWLDQIYMTALKNHIVDEVGVRGFSKPRLGFLLLMET